MPLIVTFSVLLLVGVGGVPVAAYLSGHSMLTATAILLSQLVGLAFVGLALMLLADDGQLEAAGTHSTRAVVLAAPPLALGVVVMAGGWLVARARP